MFRSVPRPEPQPDPFEDLGPDCLLCGYRERETVRGFPLALCRRCWLRASERNSAHRAVVLPVSTAPRPNLATVLAFGEPTVDDVTLHERLDHVPDVVDCLRLWATGSAPVAHSGGEDAGPWDAWERAPELRCTERTRALGIDDVIAGVLRCTSGPLPDERIAAFDRFVTSLTGRGLRAAAGVTGSPRPLGWTEIIPGLHLGGDAWAPDGRFNSILTTGDELPAPAWTDIPLAFQLGAPRETSIAIRDTRWETPDPEVLELAIGEIEATFRYGLDVLVRGPAGFSTPGLLAGLALRRLGMTGHQALAWLRGRTRPDVITNPRFLDMVIAP